MIEIKIDIISDKRASQRATMDTIVILETGKGRYMVYGDDRSNVCHVEDFEKEDGVLELVKQSIQSLIDSGEYCHINIIPAGLAYNEKTINNSGCK